MREEPVVNVPAQLLPKPDARREDQHTADAGQAAGGHGDDASLAGAGWHMDEPRAGGLASSERPYVPFHGRDGRELVWPERKLVEFQRRWASRACH